MKVAVTGASGFVGYCLCRDLKEKNVPCKVLLHQFEDKLNDLGVEIVEGSILDDNALDRLFKGVDVVFHLAAKISLQKKDRENVRTTILTGTKKVIEACQRQGVKRLIHFSTIHALKWNTSDEPLTETAPLKFSGKIAYETAKAEAELLVQKASASGLQTITLNPTAILGPYDYRLSDLTQAVLKIYRRKLPALVSGGYDFVDVRDVSQAAVNAMTRGKSGERYILSGKWMSLKQLAGLIESVTGHKTTKLTVPVALAKLGLPFVNAWSMVSGKPQLYTSESLEILKTSNRNISSLKAQRELGFNPRPMEETIRDTITWFEQNNL
jgi:dihydroflavonol-4-reductase